jgi:hypothetical protein
MSGGGCINRGYSVFQRLLIRARRVAMTSAFSWPAIEAHFYLMDYPISA